MAVLSAVALSGCQDPNRYKPPYSPDMPVPCRYTLDFADAALERFAGALYSAAVQPVAARGTGSDGIDYVDSGLDGRYARLECTATYAAAAGTATTAAERTVTIVYRRYLHLSEYESEQAQQPEDSVAAARAAMAAWLGTVAGSDRTDVTAVHGVGEEAYQWPEQRDLVTAFRFRKQNLWVTIRLSGKDGDPANPAGRAVTDPEWTTDVVSIARAIDTVIPQR
ncbi:hypothetical protein H0264_28235 [Nocardia huaxiensis]|uniref:Uncharacterized protein n=1 Tax=Nocardia huaxiensis TaxID=2755382 RepID=A0A7D6VBU4_9NOCA|nr:hypothetical protein [Nocardia huaxiensis]QLY29157.1 hypothetical protein H0264_28235 [Nocardia huaxiensis]